MYKTTDKRRNVRDLNRYMLAKTLTMFRYTGLPDTIPAKQFERLLQGNGFAFVTEVEGDLYAMNGAKGGEPDAYYCPTTINVANPALSYFETLNLKTDGVLVKNDDEQMGLLPLFEKYHSLMVENQISMDFASLNARVTTFLSASDDKTRESAERFMKRIHEGELTVIGDNAMFDGVKTHSGSATSSTRVTDLIEYHQYLKAGIFGEVGINAPFNMKRERVNSDEVGQHEESLSVLVDNMKQCRDEAIAEINQKYGTEITCEFSGVWERKRDEDKQNSMDSETGDSSDISDDFREAEQEAEQAEQAESGAEQMTTTTINEFLNGADLWAAIETASAEPLPFIDETTNMLFSTMFGESPLFSSLEDKTPEQVANMVTMLFADKWKQVLESKGVEFGADETRKVDEDTTSTKDTTDDGTETDKVSAYNSETMLDDSGKETGHTGNETGETGRVLTESRFTVQSAYDALQTADKLAIVRVALEDVAQFMKTDIY